MDKFESMGEGPSVLIGLTHSCIYNSRWAARIYWLLRPGHREYRTSRRPRKNTPQYAGSDFGNSTRKTGHRPVSAKIGTRPSWDIVSRPRENGRYRSCPPGCSIHNAGKPLYADRKRSGSPHMHGRSWYTADSSRARPRHTGWLPLSYPKRAVPLLGPQWCNPLARAQPMETPDRKSILREISEVENQLADLAGY